MITMLAIILTIILVMLKAMAIISIGWLLALLPILIAIGGWIIFYTVYFILSLLPQELSNSFLTSFLYKGFLHRKSFFI